MKKFIVVIMALITIFSASVVSFGYDILEGAINGSNLDLITNQSFGSRNCTLVYYNSTSPDVTDTDAFGNPLFQKTSYSALSGLYDNITVNGVSLAQNFVRDRTYQWYVAGGHCFILINGDRNGVFIQNQLWAGNADGKILYCDAPVSETTYTISAIAGATGYCITDRPAGTTGNGYLGDLLVTQDNLTTIHGVVSNLGGSADYYTVLRIVNGEYRYYIMCTYPNRQQYFVCNTSGQLFYALRDEVTDDGGDTGGGSTFDPTEVITAINSVYSAVNSMSSNLGSRLANILNSVNGISISVENLAANVVTGFTGVQEQLTTLNGYFSDLSGLFPVQEEITLLGSNTRVAWDSADRITAVKTSGFNTGDLTVKTNPGPLIDESGYQNVKLSPDTTEYRLYNDAAGYRRIVADNEYPDSGPAYPENSLLYFPFDDSLDSVVNGYVLDCGGTALYSNGVNDSAFLFDGSTYLYADDVFDLFYFDNDSFTLSYWIYLTDYPPNNVSVYDVKIGFTSRIGAGINVDGTVDYTIVTASSNKTGTGVSTIPLNTWTNIALSYDGSTMYSFLNGVLDYTGSFSFRPNLRGSIVIGSSSPSRTFGSGCMLDELIVVNGSALWTSNFDPYEEAVFTAVSQDYFLPCTNQNIGLVFDDTLSKTLTPTDVNGNAITMGRLEDDFSEIYMDVSTMMWYCHDPQTQTEILLSASNQQIMNDTIYVRQNYTMLPADQITADALQNLLPVDAPVYLDMPEGAKISITYDHYSGWFRAMYILMDKQNQLLNDLDIVNETIINVENTVVDITQDNDAYNIFYITKTDGTTESVGDVAKDAAVFVGDVLSMFYRLIFADTLSNVGIMNDFEDTLSTTTVGVNVW